MSCRPFLLLREQIYSRHTTAFLMSSDNPSLPFNQCNSVQLNQFNSIQSVKTHQQNIPAADVCEHGEEENPGVPRVACRDAQPVDQQRQGDQPACRAPVVSHAEEHGSPAEALQGALHHCGGVPAHRLDPETRCVPVLSGAFEPDTPPCS